MCFLEAMEQTAPVFLLNRLTSTVCGKVAFFLVRPNGFPEIVLIICQAYLAQRLQCSAGLVATLTYQRRHCETSLPTPRCCCGSSFHQRGSSAGFCSRRCDAASSRYYGPGQSWRRFSEE